MSIQEKIELDIPYSELLNFAIQAVKLCSTEIIKSSNRKIQGYKSSFSDFFTDADKLGEAAITNFLKFNRPEDGILGEEGNEKEALNNLRWVFDPLDGTLNYFYNIPHWSISIACEKFNGKFWQTIIGAVYDVIREELFIATYNGGAYLNNKLIKVNHNPLSKALIATEFSYNSDNRICQAKLFNKILPLVNDIRCFGSSALDLCWVAAGRLDGFYENELSRWDWSAASLIVQEAGGIITPFGTGVIAGNFLLHHELIHLLIINELKPQSFE